MINNRTFGYGTSHNTTYNSYIHNTTFNSYIKINQLLYKQKNWDRTYRWKSS